jgi:hypothetical protein
LTKLSAVDKYRSDEDPSLERLLDLDGEIFEVGGGYWVELHAKRVHRTDSKPHGVDYGLCLLDPDGNRLVCFDNAHPVVTGRPPSTTISATNDHTHDEKGKRKPYVYSNAETLLVDFWAEVERVLREKGLIQ